MSRGTNPTRANVALGIALSVVSALFVLWCVRAVVTGLS